MSSTDSTLCAQPCYCQTVETHSCVSASCQVFATGDFIRQSCLPRRKNASLQVFVELTKYVPRERKNTRFLLQTIRREARNTVSWPKLLGGKVSRHDSCPTRNCGKELSHDSCLSRTAASWRQRTILPHGDSWHAFRGKMTGRASTKSRNA